MAEDGAGGLDSVEERPGTVEDMERTERRNRIRPGQTRDGMNIDTFEGGLGNLAGLGVAGRRSIIPRIRPSRR